MKFIFRGRYSRDTDSHVQMGVTFKGRDAAEVTDPAAIPITRLPTVRPRPSLRRKPKQSRRRRSKREGAE